VTGERMPRDGADPSAQLIAELTRRNLRIAVAESLTGGLLTAELTRIPGASLVVSGGIVAYATPIKQTLLGVPVGLLATEGAVHPEVARAMAAGVRRALAVDGRPADIGVATTGVAGPDPQDGRPPGTVYVGIATDRGAEAIALELDGDRSAIRAATVRVAVVETLARVVGSGASRAG
jgi:nicotinamide-nucleotide amidase